MARVLLAAVLGLALALAGCTAPPAPGGNTTTPPTAPPTTPPSPPAMVAPPVHSFVATDYNFTGPTSIPGGWVTLELRNNGREPHEMALLRLDNHTFQDFQTAFRATVGPNGSAPPAWIHEAGGVGAIGPGGTARVTQQLGPGTYVLVCFVPDRQGTPHVAHGMVRELTVTPATGSMATPPQSDVTIDMVDLNFTQQPDPPTAGNHTFRVRNVGLEPHQTQVFGLKGNFTVQQLLAFFGEGPGGNDTNGTAPPPPGPPPFTLDGGVAPMVSGQEAYFTAELKQGRYVYICFVDGHFARGMIKEFTVA